MLPIQCSNEQKIKVTAAPVTASGAPATLDGGLQAEVTSGDGTFEQDPTDPNSGYFISGSALGVTSFRVFADADLGSGTRTIEDTVELTVVAAEATSLGLAVGAAEPK